MKAKYFILFCFSLAASFSLAQPANFDQLHSQAKTYFQQKEYEKSNQCYEQIIKELQSTEYESLIPTIKTSIAVNDLYMGTEALLNSDFTTAQPHLEKAVEYAKPGSKTYYSANSWLGEWYSARVLDIRASNGDFLQAIEFSKSAEACFDKAQQLDKQLNQQLTRATILAELKRNEEATSLLNSILADCEGQSNLEVTKGRALSDLGNIEKEQGKLQLAIQHLEEAYEICNDNNYPSGVYITALRLNKLYTDQIPDAKKAALWEQRAAESNPSNETFQKTKLGQDINRKIDDYFVDIDAYERAVDFIVKDKKSAEGILILNTLIEKRKSDANYSPTDLAMYYTARAQGWQNSNDYNRAEMDCLEAITLLKKAGMAGKPDLVRALYSLAVACYYQGKQQETMHAADQCVGTASDYYGPQHSETIDAIELRSNCEGFFNMKDGALRDRQQIFQKIQKNVEQNFVYLTESERVAYWEKYQPKTNIMFTFAHRLGDWQSGFTDELFNQQLLAKGLLLTTENALQRAVDKDPELKTTYQNIRQLRLKAMDPKTSLQEAQAFTKEADRLERSLGASANSLYQYMDFLKVSVSDVKAKLRPDDVAIEFVDYRIGKDSTMYAALILSPRWEHVRFLPLLEEKEVLEHSNNLNPYLWRPIFEVLEDTPENIFFSPTGLLYQLPIESQLLLDEELQNKATKTYRMSSTRWLAIETEQTPSQDAVVYGGLAYDMSVKEMKENDRNYPLTRSSDADKERTRWAVDEIKPLPGTKTEAEDIVKVINGQARNDFHAELLTGNKGTEASFKYLDGKRKRAIHIATHGFYHEDVGQSAFDPLSRSGLYFAGADNIVLGETLPSDLEDGILTADEVASLDFRGLDLIVLSACETGQGKITSDGVFGLQRGFKKAGANSIIMSLWKVDDAATSLLMTEFYKNWMEGMSKHDALESAKQIVRSRTEKGWDNPKYWAAFILLDALE